VIGSVGAAIALGATNVAPENTVPPTITGTAQVGEELRASTGTWTNNPTSFDYQWQRCAGTSGCSSIDGATGRTYGVRSADVDRSLRVVVTARNADGTATSTSDRTAVVRAAPGPSPTPVPTPTVNRRPTVTILNLRFVGARVYVRLRACDDSGKNLAIVQRDSKPGVASYVRRFATLAPPQPCAALTRSWRPAPRFLSSGRYTITIWANDRSGKTSVPARRTTMR
jgi:hypothetical protein